MKNCLYALGLLLLSTSAMAQNQLLIFTNAQSIDQSRYDGIQGDPMLFKEWKNGMIVDSRDSVYRNITLNYNGFEEDFEVQRNATTFIALNNKYYNKIIIHSEEGIDGQIVFEKSDDPKFKGKFLQVLHKGEKAAFYKYFEARKGEVVVEDVGKTRTFENFKKVSTYYMMKDGRLRVVRIKKKSLIAELGQKKALEAYIKSEKLKLGTDKDLQALLRYYEGL